MDDCRFYSFIFIKQSIFVILMVVSFAECGLHEKRLLEHIFGSNRQNPHNVLERPAKNDSNPVEVRVKSYLTQIIDVDEKNQIIHTNIWLDLKWRDYHFEWNPDDFGGVAGFNIPSNKVWKPDLLLFNSADDKFDGTYPANVVIRNNSIIQWVPPGMFKSTCNIDITWFPFDRQVCSLKFGSWSYSGQYIDLKLQCHEDIDDIKVGNCTESGNISLNEYTTNGEFELFNITVSRYIYMYNNVPFYYILLHVGIQRKPLYYIFNLIIPCILISTMALLEFTLPPDAGEKISLGVTILLSMTMFLLLVADKLPQTSGAIPLIGKYFACIMIMCSLSIVFTVLVLNYHHRSVNLKPVPPMIKIIVNTWLARILFMKPNTEDSSNSNDKPKSKPKPPPSQQPQPGYPPNKQASSMYQKRNQNPNSSFAKYVGYRLSDSDLTVNYDKTDYTAPKPGHQPHFFNRLLANSNSLDEVEEDFRVAGIDSLNIGPSSSFKFPSPPSYANFQQFETNSNSGLPWVMNNDTANSQKFWKTNCSSRNNLSAIINELKKITQKIKDDEEESLMAKEWKFAARVIDRCCLVIFSLFTLILTITILKKSPYEPVKILK